MYSISRAISNLDQPGFVQGRVFSRKVPESSVDTAESMAERSGKARQKLGRPMNVAQVDGDPGVEIESSGLGSLLEDFSGRIQPDLEIPSIRNPLAGQATSSKASASLHEKDALRETSPVDLSMASTSQEGSNEVSRYTFQLQSPIASHSITRSNIPWKLRTLQEADMEIASARKQKRKREVDQVDATAARKKARAAGSRRPPQPLRRGTTPGFPTMNAPLPPGLEDDEIITTYPNHLRGVVLLRLHDKGWGAKEIVELAQCPQLKPNTLVKRVQIAKIERDGFKPSWQSKQLQRSPDSAEQTLKSPQSWPVQAQVDRFESEASRKFRIEQTGIRDIAVEMKPDMFTRSFRCTKRTAADDRMIAERAAAEYEKRVAQRPDIQEPTC